MSFVKGIELIKMAEKANTSVIAFNCLDYNMVASVIAAAERVKKPAMIMLLPEHATKNKVTKKDLQTLYDTLTSKGYPVAQIGEEKHSTKNAPVKFKPSKTSHGEKLKTFYEKTKAGKGNFEKKYYVTQIDSELDGGNITRRFRYYPVYNKNQVATALSLSVNDRSKHNNTYFSGKAVAGRKYKLYCKCTGSGHKNVMAHVSGYWTP